MFGKLKNIPTQQDKTTGRGSMLQKQYNFLKCDSFSTGGHAERIDL